jgi:hypothetical protein
MFNISKLRNEYHYNYYTVLPEFLPDWLCKQLRDSAESLVNSGSVLFIDEVRAPSRLELEVGGRYRHYLIDGVTIRQQLPILTGIYHALLPFLKILTSENVIASPYPDSDINIKVYPPNGGTAALHKDTNWLTGLIYLTTNDEGALRMLWQNEDPWQGTELGEQRAVHIDVLPISGSLILMQGRRLLHESLPMKSEAKMVVIFNYYREGDVRRPSGMDDARYRRDTTIA